MRDALARKSAVVWLLCAAVVLLTAFSVRVSRADCETLARWGVQVGHPDQGALASGCALEKDVATVDVSTFTITPQELEEMLSKEQQGGIGSGNVPRILHQSYMSTEVAAPVVGIIKSWHSLRNWTFVWWTDDDLSWLVHTHYPQYAALFDNLWHQIMRVDFSRYMLLHRYGGLYTDIDNGYLPDKGSIEEWFQHNLGADAYVFHACTDNSMMASPPASKFWDVVFEEIQKSASNLWQHKKVNQVAGIDMLSRVCSKMEHSSHIRLMTPDDLPFSKHYNTNSWRWKSKRKDIIIVLDVIIGILIIIAGLVFWWEQPYTKLSLKDERSD